MVAGGAKKDGHSQQERKMRLGELLIAEGIVDFECVAEALKVQREEGGKIGEILIGLGYLDAKTFARFLAKQPGVASIDISKYGAPDALCSLIPRDYAVAHEVFPIDKMGKLLTVGMVCPLDTATLAELEKTTGLKVKALLCDPDDIRRAIQEHYPKADVEPAHEPARPSVADLQSVVKLEGVARLVRRIDSLPTLPQTVQRVREATEDPSVSTADMAEIIATDPPVAAEVLRLANSAAYGFLSRAESITRACVLLGLREIAGVVLSSAVINTIEQSGDFDHKRFWQHSVFCGKAAKLIAKELGGQVDSAAAFTAGLLHDIGRFALFNAVPARYVKIDPTLSGEALVAAEMEALGIDHAEAGYILAEKWEFPQETKESIRHHHTPDLASESTQLIITVALAAHMAELHANGVDPGEESFEGFDSSEEAPGMSAKTALGIYTVTRMIVQDHGP